VFGRNGLVFQAFRLRLNLGYQLLWRQGHFAVLILYVHGVLHPREAVHYDSIVESLKVLKTEAVIVYTWVMPVKMRD
jgi:hypothetical protein